MAYDHKQIESNWQQYWEEHPELVRADDDSDKKKFYCLVEFPYPSGAGLHVGHLRSYTALDIVARYHRFIGENVLYPMGWDAFGLPTENYAIKMKRQPQEVTAENISIFKKQIKSVGLSFDWSREINTTDPKYYKWTQWIFLQLFKHGLAYKKNMPINWCPSCKIGLANEEVVDGKCERCGTETFKKDQEQWMLKITAYADRLIDDLETVNFLPEIKAQQVNWIGRSEGATVRFHLSPNPSPKERGDSTSPPTPPQKGGEEIPGYITTDGQMWKLLHDKAIEMRKNPTKAEDILWGALRRDATNYHFRRQHIVGGFIVDFICLEKSLVVEVDGDIHDYQKEEDEQRTKFLNERGLEVIRFRNEEVIADVDSVVGRIIKRIEEKSENKVLPFGEDLGGVIEVFTTRPDTLFGCTYMVLSPEHELVDQITTEEQKDAVKKYQEDARKKSDLERTEIEKEKNGVFTGAYAINPVNGREIPIWIADYILAGYGTGAVMAVPAHDQRDYEFAKKYDLPIKWVIAPVVDQNQNDNPKLKNDKGAYEGDGINFDSDFLDGLPTSEAKKNITEWLEDNDCGSKKIQYHLRDWVFSRQHYWGEPIPIVHCEKCENKKYNYILLHGFTGSVQDNFFPWLKLELEKHGHTVFCPDLPNTNKPTIVEQSQYVLDNANIDENTVILGHSLGGVVAMNILQKIDTKITELILVDSFIHADFDDHDRENVEKSFDWKFDFKKIKNNAGKVLMLSDKRFSIISEEQAKEVQNIFSADLHVVFPEDEHFCAEQEPSILLALENNGWIPIPEDQLPLELPKVENYEPTDTGESPLAAITDWVNTTCPKCGGPAKRETDTMPNWAGSSWYFLRYCDPQNNDDFFGKGFVRRSAIQPTDQDKKYFIEFEKIYTDLDYLGIKIWAGNRLMLNGISGNLWLPLRTISVAAENSNVEAIKNYLAQNNYKQTDNIGGNLLFTNGDINVEIVPIYGKDGEIFSLSYGGEKQPMTQSDLSDNKLGNLWGLSYRVVSPQYNLNHYKYVRDNEPKGREGLGDDEKIKFLEDWVGSINSKFQYWTPVDLYNGGMEHVTLHLLYSRFWHKFLYDIGVVPTPEPYSRRVAHGMILAEDGRKMSKSWDNVVNPDQVIAEYGADTLRLYEMFMGPFDETIPWSMKNMIGVRRFLEKVFSLIEKLQIPNPNPQINSNDQNPKLQIDTLLHKTIKKVGEDIVAMKFNTAVSQMMIFVNEALSMGISKEQLEKFLIILSPFAPHLAEELWNRLGYQESIFKESWPQYDPALVMDTEVEMVIQVNGKVRDKIMLAVDLPQEEVSEIARESEKVKKFVGDKKVVKEIFVPNKLMNIVTE